MASDPNLKRVACESNVTDLTSSDPQVTAVNSDIEVDSDGSDAANENEIEIVHASGENATKSCRRPCR